ncbi:MAG: hypothetical protein CMJ31_12025 [Phycisphaerae bacterium]|nr:hypothetical protein [Phycisphaerae bacterium]
MPPSTTTRRFDAVICDIDGCLGPERASDPLDAERLLEVARYNRLARERLDRPEVTLCTGRPQPFAEAISRLIDNRLPMVCEMGVWLWWPEDNRYDRDPAISTADMHVIHEASEWIESTFGGKGVVQQPGKVASISLYHADTDYLKSLDARLREEFDRRGWPLRVAATWLWINIELTHVSKASGIERVMEARGFTRDRLAGIGDTIGDRAIREHVAHFACPANAQNELKPHADFVSKEDEVAGVLDILGRLVG